MNLLVPMFESIFEYSMHRYDKEIKNTTFHTREFAKRTGPKPQVSPYNKLFNAHYDIHPELTRPGGPGVYVAAGSLAYVGVPIVLASANFAIIETAPEEEQRGLWQMFSSALTGTFGGDYSGLV